MNRIALSLVFAGGVLCGGICFPVMAGEPSRQVTSCPASLAIPFHFEENAGQAGETAAFVGRGRGWKILLGAEDIVLELQKPCPAHTEQKPFSAGLRSSAANPRPAVEDRAEPVRIGLRLLGANGTPLVRGANPLGAKVSYLIGRDRRKWLRGLETFGRVRFENVYPGINLVFYERGGLEYDFEVLPGADPDAIRLQFELLSQDASGAALMPEVESGELVVQTEAGPVRFRKPLVYQDTPLGRHDVEGAFVIGPDGVASFRVGEYDHTVALVIDPVLVWSTFLGGPDYDVGYAIDTDAVGNVFVGGYTQPQGGVTDAFVAKLGPTANTLEYLVFFGGSDFDCVYGLAATPNGEAFVTGYTASTDFPTTDGAFQESYAGDVDAFVFALDPSGVDVGYSTLLGGSSQEVGYDISVDLTGNAYVAGEVYSSDFPTTAGVIRTSYAGAVDGFVTKINPYGSALIYSTYLGGSDGYECGNRLKTDSLGNAFVAGITNSSNFPVTAGAFQASRPGDLDGFVCKLNTTATALLYGTYLGGAARDDLIGLTTDLQGNAYVTGLTQSTNFPVTQGAYMTSLPVGTSAFVTKLNTTGSRLVFSTYLGGLQYSSWGRDIGLNAASRVCVLGETRAYSFPVTADAFQGQGGGDYDLFYAELTGDGRALTYGTYLGGAQREGGGAMAIGALGGAFLTGWTESIYGWAKASQTYTSDFPVTANVIQSEPGGGSDGIVVQFGDTFTLTTSVASGQGRIVPGVGTHAFLQYAAVEVRAIPEDGWRFKQWQGALSSSDNPSTVLMDQNRSLAAVFEKEPLATSGLRGKVLNPNTNQPFTCATVVARGTNGAEYVSTVDALGGYLIRGMLPGAYTVTIYSGCAQGAPVQVTLAPNETKTRDFQLVPAQAQAAVAGLVTDALTRLPLAGARVDVWRDTEQVGRTYTCTSGYYAFNLDVGAARLLLEFSSPGYQTEVKQIETLAGETTQADQDLNIKTSLSGGISGVVRDRTSNAPLAGVQVMATFTVTTVTGASGSNGNYMIPNLEAGSYQVRATKSGYNQDVLTVPVVKGQTTPRDITLQATSSNTNTRRGCSGSKSGNPSSGNADSSFALCGLTVLVLLTARGVTGRTQGRLRRE